MGLLIVVGMTITRSCGQIGQDDLHYPCMPYHLRWQFRVSLAKESQNWELSVKNQDRIKCAELSEANFTTRPGKPNIHNNLLIMPDEEIVNWNLCQIMESILMQAFLSLASTQD